MCVCANTTAVMSVYNISAVYVTTISHSIITLMMNAICNNAHDMHITITIALACTMYTVIAGTLIINMSGTSTVMITTTRIFTITIIGSVIVCVQN